MFLPEVGCSGALPLWVTTAVRSKEIAAQGYEAAKQQTASGVEAAQEQLVHGYDSAKEKLSENFEASKEDTGGLW